MLPRVRGMNRRARWGVPPKVITLAGTCLAAWLVMATSASALPCGSAAHLAEAEIARLLPAPVKNSDSLALRRLARYGRLPPHLCPPRAVPLLSQLLSDDNETVRYI